MWRQWVCLWLTPFAFVLCANPAAGLMLRQGPEASRFLWYDGASAYIRGGNISSTILRPGIGQGVDRVEFGVFLMQFYGMDIKTQTYSCDIVLTTRWTDMRARTLVPAGVDKVTLSTQQAEDAIWLPVIGVTNKAEGGHPVSSSVVIYQDGKVYQVSRQLLTLRQNFDVRSFPWDSQTLEVWLASETYLQDAVELVNASNENLTGVRYGAFFDFDVNIIGYRSHVMFDPADELVPKSRGLFTISISRASSVYVREILFPFVMLLAISWTVFHFPLDAHFVNARVSTSLIASLAYITLSIKMQEFLPLKQEFCWMDIFDLQGQILMFAAVFLNVYVMNVHADDKLKHLALRFDCEISYLMPGLTLVSSTMLSFGVNGSGLKWLHRSVCSFLMIVLMSYQLYSRHRVRQALKASVALTDER